jgi:hypothetical protein
MMGCILCHGGKRAGATPQGKGIAARGVLQTFGEEKLTNTMEEDSQRAMERVAMQTRISYT